jgi:hypothetical protein
MQLQALSRYIFAIFLVMVKSEAGYKNTVCTSNQSTISSFTIHCSVAIIQRYTIWAIGNAVK